MNIKSQKIQQIAGITTALLFSPLLYALDPPTVGALPPEINAFCAESILPTPSVPNLEKSLEKACIDYYAAITAKPLPATSSVKAQTINLANTATSVATAITAFETAAGLAGVPAVIPGTAPLTGPCKLWPQADDQTELFNLVGVPAYPGYPYCDARSAEYYNGTGLRFALCVRSFPALPDLDPGQQIGCSINLGAGQQVINSGVGGVTLEDALVCLHMICP